MDGGWQKCRTDAIYNSRTGYNYALGGHTNKILSLVVYSMHSRLCETSEKCIISPAHHQCPRNFPMEKSAKLMEGIASVQHCISICYYNKKTCQAYVKTVVTDDDSTTRANLKHCISNKLNVQYGKINWKKQYVGPNKMELIFLYVIIHIEQK